MECPYLFAFRLVENPEEWFASAGRRRPSERKAHMLFSSYRWPWCTLTIILIKLKKQANPGEQSANAEEQRIRRNRKVLKMAIGIAVAFFICWIPFFTNQLIFYFASDSLVWSSCSFILYKTVTSFMAYANWAINPIICLIFSSNYRNGLERFVTPRRTRLTFEKWLF